MLLFLALILCWTLQALSQSGDNDTQCFSTPTGELEISARVHGVPGPEGPKGEQGEKGSIGPQKFGTCSAPRMGWMLFEQVKQIQYQTTWL